MIRPRGGFSLTDSDTWAWSSHDLGETQWNNYVGGRTTSLVCVKVDLKRTDLLYLVQSGCQEEQRHPCLLTQAQGSCTKLVCTFPEVVDRFKFIPFSAGIACSGDLLLLNMPITLQCSTAFEFCIEANWEYIDFTLPSGKNAPLWIQSRLNIPLIWLCHCCATKIKFGECQKFILKHGIVSHRGSFTLCLLKSTVHYKTGTHKKTELICHPHTGCMHNKQTRRRAL